MKLAGLSRWSGTLGFDYSVPAGAGNFVIHSDSNFRSDYSTSASRYTRIAGYGVTNARVGYHFDDSWEIDVFARNLFDADYITAVTIQTGNSGLVLGQASEPRIMGVSVRRNL